MKPFGKITISTDITINDPLPKETDIVIISGGVGRPGTVQAETCEVTY